MKRSPRAIIALMVGTCLSLALGPPVGAQEPGKRVTLEESLSLFGQNSPELQLVRSRLRGALGEIRQGRAVPNPRMAVTHESLGDYSESYLNLTQPVDFLWESGHRSGRADALRTQARARFLADSAGLALEVKLAYLDAWHAVENLGAHRQAEEVMAQLLASAEARFSEGDIAGYDLRRLRFERAQFGRRTAAEELNLEDAERRLGALLLESDDPGRISAAGVGGWETAPAVEEDPVAQALRARPEIRYAEALVEALGRETSLTRASVFQGTSLTGGLKRQSDGLEGLFFGLEVPLPIADRKGGAVDAGQAAVLAAESEVDLLRRTITRQVSLASARLGTARRQQEFLGPAGVQEAQELLAIARLSFAEGEMRVVDLLDAAKAFVEARLLESQVQRDFWSAYFELEHAVGGFSTDIDNGGNER